jgi:predicted DNA-binding transcriptional regulator AlpA
MPRHKRTDGSESFRTGPVATRHPGDNDGHNACMDPTQTKIIELLREVHLIAFKEIERLNMRIVELENQNRQAAEKPLPKPAAKESPAVHPAPMKPSLPDAPELLNEHQVAKFLQLSVASVRRWRLFRTGPKYLKIGAAVRYRREDVETWLSSCRAGPE